MTNSPAEVAGKVMHDVVALFLLVVMLVLLFYPSNETKNTLHLTSTFLSTYYSNTPALTWTPPVVDPPSKTQLADSFYGCLYDAQVGFTPPVGCASAAKADFPACINAATRSFAYYQKSTVVKLQTVLADYKGGGYDLSTLPSAFTGNLAKLSEDLAASPIIRAEMVRRLLFLDTALSRALLDVVNTLGQQTGVEGCVAAAKQGPAIRHEIAPVFDELWRCTASIVQTTEESKQAFDQCVPLSAWPILDVLQTPYSGSFLGSYNKYFLLFIGGWIMLSFAVYTAWLGVDSNSDARGKPQLWLARTGKFLAIFCLVWNVVAMIIILALGFSESKDNYVMTIQTVIVTGFFSVLSIAYFAREVYEHFAYSGSNQQQYQVLPSAPASRENARHPRETEGNGFEAQFRMTNMGYFMRYPTQQGGAITLEEYTPLLVFAWADCWMFCDALLLVGLIGTSADVVTADLVRVFLTAGYSSMVHGALVRLMYEGYVNDSKTDVKGVPFDKLTDSMKPTYGLRVMSFHTHIALMVLGFINWYLILGRYSPGGGPHAVIISFVILVSLLPTVAWFIYSLILEFTSAGTFNLTSFSQVMFIYGAGIRAVLLLVAILQSTQFVDANFTGSTSLQRMLMLINS